MLRFALFLLVLSLAGCASPTPRATPAVVPRFLQLRLEQSISTIHFPRGYYSLGNEDREGYYYKAPRNVIKHSFAGSQPYDGGIFVSKRKDELRGYIIWAGGLTRIGHVSPKAVEFRD